MIYGSIPAGGEGTRMQPIGFSKELLPVNGRAAIEYLLKRMVDAGIDKIFINTSSEKTDLMKYLSEKSPYSENLIFMIRPRNGLLDGIIQPIDFLRDDDILCFGLPDTIWYPKDGFGQLLQSDSDFELGLFDTGNPEDFDSVELDEDNRITSIRVKIPNPESKWTWGIGKAKVSVLKELRKIEAERADLTLFGEIVHCYCQTNPVKGKKLENSSYLDIGEQERYKRVISFLKDE